MIKKIKVVNSYGEELVMTLSEPQESGYAITNVSGLEPTQVDVKQTQMVSGLRYKYNFGFHKFREINLQIIYFEWNDLFMDIETLRDRLYKYFKTNDLVTLYFERDYEQYAIQGYVSKHDSVVWSANCGATITVTCPDPWFRKRRIDFQDEDESASVLGIESEMYVNSVNVSYDGNIGNGFVLETETDVRNLVGEELVLESFREGTSTGKLILNVPKDYPDINCTIDSLGISLIKDSLAVYTGHKGGLCYFLCSIDGDDRWNPGQEREIYLDDEIEHINLTGSELDQAITINNQSCRILYSKSDIKNKESISFYSGIETGFVPIRYGSLGTALIAKNFDNVEHPGQEFDLEDSDDGMTRYAILGYILSDKNAIDAGTPNNYGTQSEPMDHIGWVDATSISKRVPLPRLEPGYNTITLNTSSGLPVKFKIRYNTLYRGL